MSSLLLRKKQMGNLIAQTTRNGLTLVPLDIHFNEKGVAKVAFGVGQGRNKADKRYAIADRDLQRDKARLMRGIGRRTKFLTSKTLLLEYLALDLLQYHTKYRICTGRIVMRRKSKSHLRFFTILTLAMMGGCTDTADVFPLNASAKQLGPVEVSFVRTGMASGPVTITMADGEVLTGRYRVAFGSAQEFGFSGTQSASALVITDGPVQFVANGPKTQILCRGTSTTMGHGNGQCQTYEGAVWAVSW